MSSCRWIRPFSSRRGGMRYLALATLWCLLIVWAGASVHADETVTLAKREFEPKSPAAPFQRFFSDARRLAAATTPAWSSTDGDLSAWGPALIFPLLDRSVPTDIVIGLGAPLESEGTAPVLLFRTLGLYAAKSRVPFTDTPTLMRAIGRNLQTIEHATSDLEALTSTPALSAWGSVGAGAWLAYLELLYRSYGDLGNPGGEHWDANGVRILGEVLARGQLPDGGFRRDPRDAQAALWPTALAIYALVQAYENEELVRYESAAIAAATAAETFRDRDGSYFTTLDNTSKDARANAYLAGALLLLFKDTGDLRYRDRAVGIMRWLTSGAGAAASAGDAALSGHVAYLALLLDSVSTQPYENLLGRRPMRLTVELGQPSAQTVNEMAARLRPADFRYREMFDGVLHTLIERAPFEAGDFAYDYGDAPGYAAEVLVNGGDTGIAPQVLQREERLVAWPQPRNFDEISFGARAFFAALDHTDGIDADAAAGALRRYLVLSGSLAFLDRYYFDWLDWLTNGGGFEYGPTVLGAQIASTQLRYAARFPQQRVGWLLQPLQVGRALMHGADAAAWDDSRHIYRADAHTDRIALLPNAMMIIDLVQAQQLTGDAAYLERAEAVADGLGALWDDRRGAYFARSEQMGDEAYEFLSTNSYAALALLRLYEATHTAAYRDRAVRIFDFIRKDLYDGGVIYHHLYRGRRATGDIWCTGCNWRVLYELVELVKATR